MMMLQFCSTTRRMPAPAADLQIIYDHDKTFWNFFAWCVNELRRDDEGADRKEIVRRSYYRN